MADQIISTELESNPLVEGQPQTATLSVFHEVDRSQSDLTIPANTILLRLHYDSTKLQPQLEDDLFLVLNGSINPGDVGIKQEETTDDSNPLTDKEIQILVQTISLSGYPDAKTKLYDLTFDVVGDIADGTPIVLEGEGNLNDFVGDTLSLTSSVESPVDEPPTEEPVEEPPTEEPVDETPVEEPPTEEPVDETPIEEPPTEEPPVDETPTEEPPVDETPVDEPPVDETPTEEPVDETPIEEPPVDETPVEEPPTEEPVDETPVEEPPTEEPVDETPVDEPPTEEPVDETPVDETPTEEPVDETPIEEPVDETPTVANEIIDFAVNEDANNSVINLSDTFSDVDNDDLAIVKEVISNSNSALVTTTVNGDNLTLDYQDNQSGMAEITVRGTSNGQAVDETFTVTVNPVDDLPLVSDEIDDVMVKENADDSVIDLSNTFSDIDNDDSAIIKNIASNSNEDLVTANIDGNNLTLDYQNDRFGMAEITVEAESNGEMVSDTFMITVNEVADEYLIGSSEGDLLSGGAGNDSLFGGIGDDSLAGAGGDDYLIGLVDNDFVEGGVGNDYLVGYDGDDSVSGDAGDDLLLGNQGNDTLNGGAGNDLLSGGINNDLLSGGAGNDTLWGKEGADIFVLELGQEQDLISDFSDGEDLIGLGSGATFSDLTIAGDGDAQIMDSSNNTLAVLSGISVEMISEDDFVTL